MVGDWLTIWFYYAELQAVLVRVDDRLEEVGDCLVWTGGCARGVPVLTRAAQTRLASDGFGLPSYQVRVRQLFLELAGKRPPAKVGATGGTVCTCGTVGCVAHVAYKSRSEINRAGRANMPAGAKRLWCANIAANHQGRKLTDAQVQLITESDELASVLAKRFGVAKPTIYNVRNQRTYRSYAASPWEGLGA